MLMDHVAAEKLDLERAVVLEEGSQQVSLVPRPALINPKCWILEGIKDVVEVNIDTGIEERQDLEKDDLLILLQ